MLTKLIGIGALVCYGTGLLIVNLDLMRFGVMNLGLNETSYVLAGIGFCFLTSCIIVSMAGVALLMRLTGERLWSRRNDLITAVAIGFSLFLGTFLLLFSLCGKYMAFLLGLLLAFAGAYTLIKVARKFEVFNATAFLTHSRLERYRKTHSSGTTYPVVMIGACMIWWIPIYAWSIYPNTPALLGGGMRSRVVVVFKKPLETEPMAGPGAKVVLPMLNAFTTRPAWIVTSNAQFTVLVPVSKTGRDSGVFRQPSGIAVANDQIESVRVADN